MSVRSAVRGAVAGRRERPGPSAWESLRRLVNFSVSEPARAVVRTVLKRSEVREVARRPGLATARVVAVLVVKDEAARLPFVLEYYRRIGVDHFLVLDNRSTDGIRELVLAEPDVSLFAADGVYGRSRFGNDWVNGLLRRHCVGKWILWIDADELLVFSRRPDARLPELLDELDRRGRRSLPTLMLDMYSDRAAEENIVRPGDDPLAVCRLYDRSGYVHHTDPFTRATWTKGGVRGRLFFSADVWRGPALNKTPLVKWAWHYQFLKSAHELWPAHLNEGTTAAGLLLHFKFTSTSVRKMVDVDVRSQHTAEYDAYTAVHEASFVGEPTATFVDAGSVVADGLFAPLV